MHQPSAEDHWRAKKTPVTQRSSQLQKHARGESPQHYLFSPFGKRIDKGTFHGILGPVFFSNPEAVASEGGEGGVGAGVTAGKFVAIPISDLIWGLCYQLVQSLPREAENPTAHNLGYVYISRTPFEFLRGGVLTPVELIGQSGVREVHGIFLTPPSPPGVSLLPFRTCADSR